MLSDVFGLPYRFASLLMFAYRFASLYRCFILSIIIRYLLIIVLYYIPLFHILVIGLFSLLKSNLVLINKAYVNQSGALESLRSRVQKPVINICRQVPLTRTS